MKKGLLLGMIALMFSSACTSLRVYTDYDTGVNFSTYKTFAFYKPGIDKAEISDLDKRRILRAIEGVLEEKGYRKSENADLLITIATKEEDDVTVTTQTIGGWGWGWGWGFNPWMMGPAMNNQNINTTNRGELIIDLLDAGDERLIWQGKGRGLVTDVRNPQKRQGVIDTYVSAILAKFPTQGSLRPEK
ncbi:MAG: hypothetical protein RLZZ242_1218 [Bacteroidota bacterium]